MPCKMCRERGQTWSGDAPKCAFENGEFWSGNWNCATVNAIRDLCEQDDPRARPRGVVMISCGDMNYALISPDFAEDWPDERAHRLGGPLYLSWYKHRGRTDRMLVLTEHARLPVEDDCAGLIAYYRSLA